MILTAEHLIKTVAGFALLAATWMVVSSGVSAQDLDDPARVVNEYLTSLVNGDTQQLILLIDGKMKNNNKQLVLNPETYSQFLKAHYKGVRITVENIEIRATTLEEVFMQYYGKEA